MHRVGGFMSRNESVNITETTVMSFLWLVIIVSRQCVSIKKKLKEVNADLGQIEVEKKSF